MSSVSENSSVRHIQHTELGSVVFVRDYIQLVFEGDRENATLTAFTLPEITIGLVSYKSQTSGYRDALCSLINNKVLETYINDKQFIKLIFENEVVVQISLREEDYDGPEAAMLKIGNSIEVW